MPSARRRWVIIRLIPVKNTAGDERVKFVEEVLVVNEALVR